MNWLVNQTSPFSKNFDAFTVGFDKLVDEIREASEKTKKSISYPPYNIKQVDENNYVIEMAVAGFGKTDIDISLDNNKLTVSGHVDTEEGEEESSYLWKGIANRAFQRTFTLADTIEVQSAEMVNGMLKLGLQNIVKANDAIKKIAIK
jgi:molecular chaperone IbpA